MAKDARQSDDQRSFTVAEVASTTMSLVESSMDDIAESIVLADRLDRLRNSIVNRAKRGEYTPRAAVNAAFQQSRPMVDAMLKRQTAALQSALLNLAKVNSSESPKSANK